jgi:hypothetical protein
LRPQVSKPALQTKMRHAQRERERERTADLLRVRRRLTQLMKEISGLDYTVRGFMGGQGLKRRATFSLLLHSGCC